MEDYEGSIPKGWRGGEAVTKWWRGKFIHLFRLRKNCTQCDAEMILDVTRAAIEGKARNAGLYLSRCMECRAKSEPGTSRPLVLHPTTVPAEPQQPEALKTTEAQGLLKELEQLRCWKATVSEELQEFDNLGKENYELRIAAKANQATMQALQRENEMLKKQLTQTTYDPIQTMIADDRRARQNGGWGDDILRRQAPVTDPAIGFVPPRKPRAPEVVGFVPPRKMPWE